MRILVTGGTGFFGSRLIEKLLERGHEVIELGRNVSSSETKFFPWTLGMNPDPNALAEVDFLIHAAWATGERNLSEMHLNVGGSKKLINAANFSHIKTIFISTTSATSNKSFYGQGKKNIEGFNSSGINIRLGKLISWEENSQEKNRFLKILFLPVPVGLTIEVIDLDYACGLLIQKIENKDFSLLSDFQGQMIPFTFFMEMEHGFSTVIIPMKFFVTILGALRRIPVSKFRLIVDKWDSLVNAKD